MTKNQFKETLINKFNLRLCWQHKVADNKISMFQVNNETQIMNFIEIEFSENKGSQFFFSETSVFHECDKWENTLSNIRGLFEINQAEMRYITKVF